MSDGDSEVLAEEEDEEDEEGYSEQDEEEEAGEIRDAEAREQMGAVQVDVQAARKKVLARVSRSRSREPHGQALALQPVVKGGMLLSPPSARAASGAQQAAAGMGMGLPPLPFMHARSMHALAGDANQQASLPPYDPRVSTMLPFGLGQGQMMVPILSSTLPPWPVPPVRTSAGGGGHMPRTAGGVHPAWGPLGPAQPGSRPGEAAMAPMSGVMPDWISRRRSSCFQGGPRNEGRPSEGGQARAEEEPQQPATAPAGLHMRAPSHGGTPMVAVTEEAAGEVMEGVAVAASGAAAKVTQYASSVSYAAQAPQGASPSGAGNKGSSSTSSVLELFNMDLELFRGGSAADDAGVLEALVDGGSEGEGKGQPHQAIVASLHMHVQL